jgi:hypothetical protein
MDNFENLHNLHNPRNDKIPPNIGWRMFFASILVWTATMRLIDELTCALHFNSKNKTMFYSILLILSFLYLLNNEKYIDYIL